MRSLLGVELTRLRWRRAVLLLLVGAVVVPALIGASRVWDTRPLSAEEVAAHRAAAQPEITHCESRPRQYGLPRGASEQCEQTVLGWYTGREPLLLPEERRSSGTGLALVLTMLMLLVGTTFVGHDWNTGSMTNQLLFEPRRGRVWAAKGLAVLGVGFVVSAVVSAAYWLALWAVARSRDLPAGTEQLADSLELALRASLLAGAAALGGYALTMLLRSTVATIGVLFAVSVVGGLLVGVLGLSGRWQPQVNLDAVVQNGTTYYAEVPQSCYQTGEVNRTRECDETRRLSLGQGSAYYGVLLLLAGGASITSFRRRDVG